MIRINLLGKKKASQVPFGLEEKLEKIGIKYDDLYEMRWALLRVAIVGIGLYLGNHIPTQLHDEKSARLDQETTKLAESEKELQKQLLEKKDVRKQMDMLNKEEVELQRQLNAVGALQKGRGLAFNTLDDLMIQLGSPKKVWLEDLKFENKKISFSGRAWEWFPINDLVKSITESTRYSNVVWKDMTVEASKYSSLNGLSGVSEGTAKIKRFNLEYTVKDGQE